MALVGYASDDDMSDVGEEEVAPELQVGHDTQAQAGLSHAAVSCCDGLSAAAQQPEQKRADATGAVHPDAQSRIEQYAALAKMGHDLTSTLVSRKAFQNPSILENVIQYFDLQDSERLGTCYPPETWSPIERQSSDSAYMALAVEQKEQQQRYEELRQMYNPATAAGGGAAAVGAGLQFVAAVAP